ncbi:hypothetical protein H072_2263 [Dactylellina haptotyla CBS 200.50]|uniref:Phosphoglycerate mutase n=1 Tax=Dactylellina haptotyla (strain CBS 200.50) TaxID=1284197 RepID=S8ARV5_DACHA|nr:hypothetical protein H072_2263 [Dactylellina haptotyla CBS 200.50]
MPPRLVYLVRHAEGHHNINWAHYIRDPDLTDKGHNQCQTLAANFPYHSRITTVLCSPLKRTIQTTLESFHPAISRLADGNPSFKIITNPYVQETGEWECDIGTKVPELQEWFGNYASENPESKGYAYREALDFSIVESDVPEWPQKEGKFAASKVAARAEVAREYLFDNFGEDEELVIVSHGGFLHYLTDDWADYDESMGTAWSNTDWRSYEVTKGEDGKVKLVEKQRGRELHSIDGKETEKAEVEAGGHNSKV